MAEHSYPEGQKIDYNKAIIKILKKKGIKICPSAIEGVNNKETDFFNLKRIQIS